MFLIYLVATVVDNAVIGLCIVIQKVKNCIDIIQDCISELKQQRDVIDVEPINVSSVE